MVVSKGVIIAIIIAVAGAAAAAGVGVYFMTHHHYGYPHHAPPQHVITVGKTPQTQKPTQTQTTPQKHRVQARRRVLGYGEVFNVLNIAYRNATENEAKLFNETLGLVEKMKNLKELTIDIPVIKVILSGYGTSMKYTIRNMVISFDKIRNMTYIEMSVSMYSATEKIMSCTELLHNNTYRTCTETIMIVGGRKIVRRSCNMTSSIMYGIRHRIRITELVSKLLKSLRNSKYYYVTFNSTSYVCKCGLISNLTNIGEVSILPTYASLKNLTLCLCLHPGSTYPELMIMRTYSGGVSIIMFMYVSKIEPYFNYTACESVMK